MKRLHITILTVLGAIPLPLAPAASNTSLPPEVAKALAGLKPSHPRLILTNRRLAELKTLAGRDALLKKCIGDVLKRAAGYAKRPPPTYRLRGPRLLSVSRDALNRVYALALAWRLTGKEIYAAKAREVLAAVCAFKDWNPRHFLDTAEMSHAVGIGYDWLFDVLRPAERKTLRDALIAKGLVPGLKVYARGGWWVKSAFNWNQVCNGGMLIGALAVAETDPRYLREILPQAVESLPKALASYEPDGAWPEGPGYWNYATRYTVYALAALRTALGTDLGLSERRGLSQAGLFPLYLTGPTGLYFNFADVSGRSRRRLIPALLWLARRYDKPLLAAAERAMLARHSARPQDVIWYVPPGKHKPAPLPLDKHFRGSVEVAVFRSAWDDPDALFLAVKAGYNQVNHGHLDLGNFELDALGVRWAKDLGSDNYNLPGYWDRRPGGRRWNYYRLGSFSHNVLVLNGRHQDALARSRITRFAGGGGEAFAIVDLSAAYKGLAAKVLRGVALLRGRRAALVQDELVLPRPCEVAWGMTTEAQIVVQKDRATLRRGGKELLARVLSPAGAVFTVESARREPPENPNRGVRRLMVRLPKQRGSVRLVVLLAPLWPGGQVVRQAQVVPLSEWKPRER